MASVLSSAKWLRPKKEGLVRLSISDADCWWHLFESLGDVAVYRVDLTPNARREAQALAWLGADERLRWEGSRSLDARRRFLLCRAGLRALLCQELCCCNETLTFETAVHGKPSALVDGSPACISFNVSHSGAHGLIAMAPRGRLGVDVEERHPCRNLEGLIRRVLHPTEESELESLGRSEQLQVFLRFWTIKEALVKAHGQGISMRVADLEIPEDMRRGAITGKCRFSQMPSITWRLDDIGTDEFAAAVAHEVDPRA